MNNSTETQPNDRPSEVPEKKKSSIWIPLLVVIILVGGFFLLKDRITPPEELPEPGSIESHFVWVVKDDSLNQDAIDRFHQKYLNAKAALESDPDNFSGWLNLGEAKQSAGDDEGARDAWEHLSSIRPNNSLSFGNLATIYTYDLYDAEKAAANYETAITNSMGEPFNTNYYRNYFEFQLFFVKDKTKAEQVLLEGIENNPESPDLLTLLAGFYAEEGRNEEAIEYYEKSLDINPENTAANNEIRRLQSLDS